MLHLQRPQPIKFLKDISCQLFYKNKFSMRLYACFIQFSLFSEQYKCPQALKFLVKFRVQLLRI